MAEAVGAISLAACIISVKDYGDKVITRLQAFRSRVIEVPKEFRNILVLLPDVLDILVRTGHLDVAGLLVKPVQVVFLPLVLDCYAAMIDLGAILKDVSPRKRENSVQRGKKALQSVGYEKDVKTISENLRKNALVFLYCLGPPRNLHPNRTLSIGAQNSFDIPIDRSPKFIGRVGILQQLRDAVKSGQNIALVGLDGVGKTQIALEAAYRYKETESGHVFWADASSIQRFVPCYRDIAKKFLTLSDFKSTDANFLSPVRDWLARNGPWLLILDNVDCVDLKGIGEVESIPLLALLPRNADGHIIIISNDMMVGEVLAGKGKCISVLPPDQTEAEDILQSKLVQDTWDLKSGGSLVRILDRNPLAINQAAAFIRENNLTLDMYLGNLQADSSDLGILLTKDLGNMKENYQDGIRLFSAWKLSFDQVTKEQPRAAEILYLMAVLDRQGVPKFLLEKENESNCEFTRAIDTLQAYSFITVKKETPNTFAMHRSVHLATQLKMKSEGRLLVWHSQALNILQKKFVFSHSEDPYICESIYPHALLVVSYKCRGRPDELARAKLRTQMADYEVSRYMLDIAHERVASAVECMAELEGKNYIMTLRSRLQLVSIMRMQGVDGNGASIIRELLARFKTLTELDGNDIFTADIELALSLRDDGKAENLLRKLAANAQQSKDSWSYAKALDVLGVCLLKQGKRKDASKFHDMALNMKMRLLGPKSEWKLVAEATLDVAMNPFNTNASMKRQILTRQEQVLGPEHPDTLLAVTNLARSLIRDLKYKEAEPLARRALAGGEGILGGKHPQTLVAMQTVAVLYRGMDQDDASVKYFEKAIKGFEKALGYNDSRTRSCWWDYLSLARERRILDRIMTKPFPDDHPVSLVKLSYRANTLYDNGNYREAQKLQRESLALFKIEFGPDDLWTLTATSDLGLTLIELWDFSEAEKLFRQVLIGQRKKLAPDHPDTLKTMNALGVTLWNMKGDKLAESEAIFRDLVAVRTKLGQIEDVGYLSTRNNLALLEFERGDNEAALKTHRALLPDRQRIQGKNHPETLLTMLSISMALGYLQEYQEALEWNEKAVTGLIIFPGPDHPNTLVARSHLAKIQSMLGQLGAAEETIRSVIAARLRVLGPRHGNTLKSRARLGSILELQGRFEEALTLEEDICTVAAASFGVDHPESRGHKASLENLRFRISQMDAGTNRSAECNGDVSRKETEA